MKYDVVYFDALPFRREDVMARLARPDAQILAIDRLSDVPREAGVVLVGAADLRAALPDLIRIAREGPHRQLLLLWEGQDQQQLIEAIHAGVRDVIPLPSGVPEAVQRAQVRLVQRATEAPAEPTRQGRIVGVFSPKGGIGKSMLTANLAIFLHQISGRRTVAVDLSLPCGNLDMYLNLNPPRTVGDVLARGEDLDASVLNQALARHPSGIMLLAGPRSDTIEAIGTHSSLPLFGVLAATPGVVIVDLGSFIEQAQATALEAMDLVIVPVAPLISSVGTMPAVRQMLRDFGVTEARVLPVLNRAVPDGENIPADLIAKLMGGKPRHVLPWGGHAVSVSLNEGSPLAEQQSTFPLARAMSLLASDVLTRVGFPVTPEAVKPASWQRLTWLTSLFSSKGTAHVHP